MNTLIFLMISHVCIVEAIHNKLSRFPTMISYTVFCGIIAIWITLYCFVTGMHFIYILVNIDQNQMKLVLINITYRKKYSTILSDIIVYSY